MFFSTSFSLPFANIPVLDGQGLWLILCLLLYPLFSWLFGGYTVLRWRHLPFFVLVQRLFISTTVTLIAVAFIRWVPQAW